MSAYICNPEHIGALAAFAAHPKTGSVISECLGPEINPIGRAILVAELLMRGNIESVAYRYNEKPAPPVDEFIASAEEYAAYYIRHPPTLRPIDIIRMVECLDYQSCEPPNWNESLAKRQLDWILSAAIRQLPGYDTAIRDFSA